MKRIHAQAIDMEFIEPVQRILHEEFLDLGTPEIDRRAPGRVDVVTEEGAGIGIEIVAVRSEVVIDHVQEDLHAQRMGGVDQGFQLVRRSIGGFGRILQHAVIAPVAAAGKGGDRHEFDSRNAQPRQRRQHVRHAGKAATGAHMQFVQHGLLPVPAAPVAVAPLIAAGVHHDAGTVCVAFLGARGGVRHLQLAVQAKHVAGAGATIDNGFEPAIGQGLHRNAAFAMVEHDVDPAGVGRPEAEAGQVGRQQGGAIGSGGNVGEGLVGHVLCKHENDSGACMNMNRIRVVRLVQRWRLQRRQ